MNPKRIQQALKKFERHKLFLSDVDYLKSRQLFEQLLKENTVSAENVKHCYDKIFPMVAIYKTLQTSDEEALIHTRDIFYESEVYPGTKKMAKFMKIPFVYKLIPRLAVKMVKKYIYSVPTDFKWNFCKAIRKAFVSTFTSVLMTFTVDISKSLSW